MIPQDNFATAVKQRKLETPLLIAGRPRHILLYFYCSHVFVSFLANVETRLINICDENGVGKSKCLKTWYMNLQVLKLSGEPTFSSVLRFRVTCIIVMAVSSNSYGLCVPPPTFVQDFFLTSLC